MKIKPGLYGKNLISYDGTTGWFLPTPGGPKRFEELLVKRKLKGWDIKGENIKNFEYEPLAIPLELLL